MFSKKTSNFVVILCGGTGPRLWPLSRVDKPKQFLKLFSNNSLLKDTFLRAQKIVPKKNIFVISNHKYLSLIKEDLKNLVLTQNIISEPEKKNTALAILYASAIIQKIDPDAIITTMPSDHFIGQINNFKKDLQLAVKNANNKYIVTLGIKPNNPSTSFGYIFTNSRHEVLKFIEKPNLLNAQKFIQKDNCFWNSGIYTFKFETLISEFRQHSPQYLPLFNKIQQNLNQPKIIEKIYSISPSLAIDTAISEKSRRLFLIPVSFSWNDVGEWKSIYQQLSKDSNQIAILNKNTNHIEINSQNCLISSTKKNKLIGLVDINNLAIIDTDDALLICNINLDGSYHVRDLVSKIVQNKKIKHYFADKND